MLKGGTGVAFIGLAVLLTVVGATTTSAQEWRRGEFEYMRQPHHFGPLCEYGIRARGVAPVALFGGAHEVRKAEARAIQDWEFETSRLFGPRYAGWALAMGKELRCEAKG